MKVTEKTGYIRIDAHSNKINRKFLNGLVDFVGQVIAGYPASVPPILLVVKGPDVELDPVEGMEVWKRAAEIGVQRTRIAYVISGRPFSPVARLIETYAFNRGIQLRFFGKQTLALKWLL